ncbi:MAG: hypothetical protein HYY93_11470 [Planctomycetes bacterium]|nr:hypothetical protein [Planctomycetota bacterium]
MIASRRCVCALVSLLLLAGCAHRSAGRAGDPVAGARRAQERGVEFLVRTQNADGSWGTFESARPYEIYLGTTSSFRAFQVATSALCCTALIEPSRGDLRVTEALGRGVQFLLGAPATGRATGDTFYDTWAHCYLLQAVSEVARDPRFEPLRPRLQEIVDREIAILDRMQGGEGGWGYYDFGFALSKPTGNESTSFLTGAVLVALHEAEEAGFTVPGHMTKRGRICLERLRLGDGAYIYGTYAQFGPERLYNRVKGSLGRTQAGNMGLVACGSSVVGEKELRTGLDHLFAQHHFISMGRGRPYPHEAWYYTAGYYFFFGHYYAARCIDHLPEADRARYRTLLRDHLVPLQDPEGSFFDFPLYGYHKPYGTALALMALQRTAPW